MTPRLCYPTDVPTGAKLVDADLIVAAVTTWNDGKLVVIADETMRAVMLDPAERILIDEDTPERIARLSVANAIVSGARTPNVTPEG